MAIQKKHGKGRLDKWYRLAKEKGYRARAAFKLVQLNKKYGFLEKSRVVIDLCAAPGSWCQVAAETCPVNSLIIGVDLAPIKPIPKVITFQSDITSDKCRATIRQHLKLWKADTVLHDGAPNVGTAWVQDAYSQAELVLQSMRLATDFLIEGGTFVTKVFRSKDYNSLLWVFKQLFTSVEATKPPSSRNVSAEIFVVCRGFKAPKRIDPRFLDPRAVFAELADPTPNNEAKVFNPEVKKRKRDGYEEGDYTQFKELPASEFIQTTDPIAILGSYNKLTFEQAKNGDVALAALDKMPETTDEIRLCCQDLRVLGRKEFKTLLKWRLQVREIFGFPTKKTAKPLISEEVAQVDSMDEETKIQEQLRELQDKDNAKKKKEKRKENERKQKEIVRAQLNMNAPMDIGMEQAGPTGDGSMFALKALDKSDTLGRIVKGKMAIPSASDTPKPQEKEAEPGDPSDDESDDAEDRLERELDSMYDEYRERKAEADAKYRAKRARKEHDDGEWEGLSASENEKSESESELDEESDDDITDDDGAVPKRSLVTELDNEPSVVDGLSKRARSFWNQDMFKDIPGLEDGTEEALLEVQAVEDEVNGRDVEDMEISEDEGGIAAADGDDAEELASDSEDDEFEVVEQDHEEEDWEETDRRRADGTLDVDIITAEAMTLAHAIARGEKTKHDVIDDGFNKHAFRDRDGLPEWFLEDESQHDKIQRPRTKAAADAIKEKMRAFNARPIKKVREAKARKKLKAAMRLEKLKKKSDLLASEEGMTEKEKADSIAKLLSKAAKRKPRQATKVVVARGVNRGIKSRPKGVKGRYKMVDPRMKKETRALKRVAAKQKKRR